MNSNPSGKTKHKLGEMREWILKKELMPQIIIQINRVQKNRYNEYLSKEFSESDFAKNDLEYGVIETNKYPEYVFLQSANPHKLCLKLWNDKVLNKYMHQTYLIQSVTTDINFIANHKLLFDDKNKIFKLFGCKRCISILGPLIPKEIKLSASEKKCTHVIYIIKAYQKYYFGIFDKKYCYGYLATNTKLKYSQFDLNSSISRAYYKLRELFKREEIYFKSLLLLKNNFIALDIGSSPGGWTKFLIDIGAKHVVSIDPGQLQLNKETMKSVTYFKKTVEKCISNGDLSPFVNKNDRFDIIVCDANMDPMSAVLLIDQLSYNLKDNGFIVFTLKMPDRRKYKMVNKMNFCIDVMNKSFENINIRFLLANKSKERTLIATKKRVCPLVNAQWEFHEINSF